MSEEIGTVKVRNFASYPGTEVDELPENPPRKERVDGSWHSGPRTPRWTNVLDKIAKRAEAGEIGRQANGELKFVLAAEFNTAAGARNVVKSIEDNPSIMPEGYAFDFETRRFITDAGKKGSKLFVRVAE